jgi:hypothetical protein
MPGKKKMSYEEKKASVISRLRKKRMDASTKKTATPSKKSSYTPAAKKYRITRNKMK